MGYLRAVGIRLKMRPMAGRGRLTRLSDQYSESRRSTMALAAAQS